MRGRGNARAMFSRIAISVSAVIGAGAVRGQDPPSRDGARPTLVAQSGHSFAVSDVAFSADGRFVWTSSSDSTARMWDAATGRAIRTIDGSTSVAVASGVGTVLLHPDDCAMLLDGGGGREVGGFSLPRGVCDLRLSADGQKVLTSSLDGTASLWSVSTGEELCRFVGHLGAVIDADISTDGLLVATASWDGTARIWDAVSGRELVQLEGHEGYLTSIALSGDGALAITSSDDGTVRVWDVATGSEYRRFDSDEHGSQLATAMGVALSPDGRLAAMGMWDWSTRIWDVESGRELHAMRAHGGQVHSVAFSPDGAFVLAGGYDGAALYDTATGALLQKFAARAGRVNCVAISADGEQLLTCGGGGGTVEGTAWLWDAVGGSASLLYTTGSVYSDLETVAFSPDAQRALISGSRIHDLRGGGEPVFLNAPGENSAVFSSDGKFIVSGSDDKTVRLFDAATGAELLRREHENWVKAVAFAPDGRRFLSGGWDRTVRVWDAASGAELMQLQHDMFDYVEAAAWSADGALIATGGHYDNAYIWDAATGVRVRELAGHDDDVQSVAFSHDGRRLLTASEDKTARLWDVASGALLRRFDGHTHYVTSAEFSPDDRLVVTASTDGSTRIWDAESGAELCRLYSFDDGGWAVVDSDGRFDGSNGGDVEGLHWVIETDDGPEVVALGQLKEMYYEPGLLAKKLGYNKEPLRDVGAFIAPRLHPVVVLFDPAAGDAGTRAAPVASESSALRPLELSGARIGVRLTNRAGGIGCVAVFVNGKELLADARGAGFDGDAARGTIEIDLANCPYLIPGEANAVEVYASNSDGSMSSSAARGMVRIAAVADAPPPEFWAVVVGVSDYDAGPEAKLDLRFAGRDAAAIASALQMGAARLFGAERTHVTLLTTDGPEEGATDSLPMTRGSPTKAEIIRALEAAKTAKSTDVFVLYLAGHGVTVGGAGGDFHYLTREARTADLTLAQLRQTTALSSKELTELLKRIPALKQVLILDTCASGQFAQAVIDLAAKRDVPGSQIRALQRLKDRTGLHVLAGCASDAVSYEASRYGQGVLTYALLMGLRGGEALREGRLVDVSALFQFARQQAPLLAGSIGGIQQPVIASPRGSSFAIGALELDERARIPLAPTLPLVVRPRFQDRETFGDPLGLEAALFERLNDESASAASARCVFVDVAACPEAYKLSGQYSVDGETAIVEVRVLQLSGRGRSTGGKNERAAEREIARFEVRGAADGASLARAVVEQALERLPRD